MSCGSSSCSIPAACRNSDIFTPCAYYLLSVEKGFTLPHRSTPSVPCSKAGTVSKKNEKRETSAEDDDFDLFGEQTPEEIEAANKLAEKKKAEVKAASSKKKVVINKSSLVIDIKPNNAETNLDEITKLVRQINMEGLSWGEAVQKVPVAFGLFKLRISCVIIDDLVNTNELVDFIEVLGMSEEKARSLQAKRDCGEDDDEEEDGLVQSVEIVSFNKL